MAEAYKERQYIIQFVFVLAAVVLIGKAMHLQLFDKSIQDRAKTSAVQKKIMYPSRGLIYDRKGQLMIYNDPIYDLMVTYNQLDKGMDTTFLCEILEIDKPTFLEKIEKDFRNIRYSKAVPFIFQKKIPRDIYAKLQESLYEFPGFSIQQRIIRGYPDTVGAHLLGYISEVNQDHIDKNKDIYSPGDYIGMTGLEGTYETYLRGRKGMHYYLKDNLGRVVGPYLDGELDSLAISGKNLITSIDLELQRYAETLMQNKTGSIVAIEPSTGEVLAMVSAPTYDPNLLVVNNKRGKVFQEMQQDSLKPFFNRAVAASYPPGSLFKPIVALIGMQEDVWKPYRGVRCDGAYHNVNHYMGCHAHQYPSDVSIAIQHSCNSYFLTLFRAIIDKEGFHNPHIGLDRFNAYLDAFGMGRKLGLDFRGEKKGLLPTSNLYNRMYPNGRWRSPTIISVGIGQGEIELTNLQMANLAAILANRGYYYTPHLVKGFGDETEIDLKYRTRNTIPIDPSHYPIVIEGMERVVTMGTARSAYTPGISVCGKTGTAENPHGKDHSIFYGFAPRENPQIAIAVYLENAGFGGSFAAPIASLVIEKYINGEISENRKLLEERMRNVDLIGMSSQVTNKEIEEE